MRVLKESFNGGEFTPRLYSRYELAKYKNGCKTLTNFIPLAHGPVIRRPGFEYIAAVKDSSDVTVLIPFEFSETDSYIIEAGDQYFRFYRNGGQIQTADAYTKLLLHFDGTNNSTVITDDGDTGHSLTVAGNARLKTFKKMFGSASLFCDGSTDYLTLPDHADINFGTGKLTIDFWVRFNSLSAHQDFYLQYDDATNYIQFYWNTANTLNFKVVVTTTILNLSGSWTPVTDRWYHLAVVRGWGGNANDWAITVDGSSVDTDTQSITMPDLAADAQIGAGTTGLNAYLDEFRISKGVARWTANFALPTAQYPYGDSSGTAYELATTYTQDVLANLYYVQSADTMYIVHEDFVVRKLVRSDHDNWAISNVSFTNAPDEWGAGDYPRTIDFYEDRLVFGGNPDNPDNIYTSDTGLYTTFTESETPSDDESVQLTLGARRVNDIRWISGGRRLIIGTSGEEWWLAGPTDSEPITPSDHVGKRDSAWGSDRVRPVNIGDAIFFVQRNGRIVREMRYDFGSDRYVSSDITILSEHLTKTYKIIQIAYQQHPYQILWCLREDGTLISLTYLKEHDVVGWAKHSIGGSGVVNSIAVIPGDSEDELWAVVERTINSSTVQYIERMKPFNWGTDLEDAFFIDSGLTYEGPSATSISGLDHLEGETVVGMADGVAVSSLTVTSGTITLSSAASKVHLGLSNTPEFETLDVVAEDKDGSLQGIIKRITNISIHLINSMGGLFGPSSSTTDSIPYDDTTTPYTGWTDDLSFDEGSENESTVYIQCDEPYPMEIGAINIDLED